MNEREDRPQPPAFGTDARPGRSTWENFRDVILEPSTAFEDVAERPRWLAPMGVLVAATAVVSWVMMPMVIEARRLQILQRPTAQQELALERLEAFAGWFGVVFSVVSTPLIVAILAFLFWGFALVGGAKNSTFKVAFSAMTYAGAIYVLQGIAQAVVVVVKGAETVAREGGPPTFGLGLFLERGEMPALLWGLVANVNFFAVWYAIVVAVAGTHALRMGRGAAWTFAALLWLLGAVALAFQR